MAISGRAKAGIAGNVITFVMFLLPLKEIFPILNGEPTEDMRYFPYIASLTNCCFWIIYSLPCVRPNSILVLSTNITGLLQYICYLWIFVRHSNQLTKRGIYMSLLTLACYLIFISTVFLPHTQPAVRMRMIGGFSILNGTIMYSSCLYGMGTVFDTGDRNLIPMDACLLRLVNTIDWVIYARLGDDLFIIITNAAGGAISLFQLLVYVYYWIYPGQPAIVIASTDAVPEIDIELAGIGDTHDPNGDQDTADFPRSENQDLISSDTNNNTESSFSVSDQQSTVCSQFSESNVGELTVPKEIIFGNDYIEGNNADTTLENGGPSQITEATSDNGVSLPDFNEVSKEEDNADDI